MHNALILLVLSAPRCLYAFLYPFKHSKEVSAFSTLLATPSKGPNKLLAAVPPGGLCLPTQHTSQALTSQLQQTQLIAQEFILHLLKEREPFTFSLVEGINFHRCG